MRPRSTTLACRVGVWLAPVCFALPSIAAAEVTTFAQAGHWEAFGGTASDGKPVCGVAARDDAMGQAMTVKWFSGDPFLTIQVLKKNWSMANHSDIPVSLRIDGYPTWSATASGSGHAVEWVLSSDSIGEFETEFRKGASLTLHFQLGADAPWQASLAGSQAIVHSMVACMKRLRGV